MIITRYIIKELLYQWYNRTNVLIALGFFISGQLLFCFVHNNLNTTPENTAFFIMFLLLFSHILMISISLEDDYRNHIYEQLLLRNGSLTDAIIAKYISTNIISCFFIAIIIIVYSIFISGKHMDIPITNLLLVLTAFVPLMNLYILFCSSLMLNSAHHQLLALLLLPLIIPIMILGIKACVAIEYISFLCGILLINLPIILKSISSIITNNIRYY